MSRVTSVTDGRRAGASVAARRSARTWARLWFAAQALGGAAWWVAVPTIPAVRVATLGSLDPLPVALLDIPLFVVGSALAAAGIRARPGP
jgi:hypothetical protein